MNPFRQVLRSEWIKLWSVRSTRWCLGAAVVVVPLFGVLTALTTDPAAAARPRVWQAEHGFDPMAALSGMLLAQFAFGVLGALTITAEHSSGQLRVSLVAVPRLRVLYAAKLAVLGGTAAAVAAVLALGTFLLAQALYPAGLGIGITGHGAWEALLGTVVYAVFITVFGFAVGALVRGTGAALTVFMAVTFVVMSALPAVFPSSLRDRAADYTFVGLAQSLTTLRPDAHPTAAVAALVLVGYAVLALLPSLLVAERR